MDELKSEVTETEEVKETKAIDLNTAFLAFMGTCLVAFLVASFMPNFPDARLTMILETLKYFGLAVGVGAVGYAVAKKE